jgi:hypothetical protein
MSKTTLAVLREARNNYLADKTAPDAWLKYNRQIIDAVLDDDASLELPAELRDTLRPIQAQYHAAVAQLGRSVKLAAQVVEAHLSDAAALPQPNDPPQNDKSVRLKDGESYRVPWPERDEDNLGHEAEPTIFIPAEPVVADAPITPELPAPALSAAEQALERHRKVTAENWRRGHR